MALALYIKTGCPWCKKVLDYAHTHGISFSTIKEKYEPGVVEELVTRGGKTQFPYLVDESTGVEMYESEDIIRYLASTYSTHAIPSGVSSQQGGAQSCPINLD